MPAKHKITVYPSDEMQAAIIAYAAKRNITLSAALLELAAKPLNISTPKNQHGGRRISGKPKDTTP